jgi:hypothetical protein
MQALARFCSAANIADPLCPDLTGILYQSEREYIAAQDSLSRASASSFACL